MNKKYQIFLVAIAVAAITAAVFIPSLAGSFLNWDDGRLLEFSGWRGFSPPRVEWWFSSFAGGDYKPLVWASYACDYAFWGLNPVGYHLSNVILHSLNAFLLFLLLRALATVQPPGESARGRPLPVAAGFSLRNDSRLWIPFISALFFSLPPLRVETVAWITERKGCLSSFFFLLSVLWYASYACRRQRVDPAPWRYLGALLAGACAGLAKPSAISLPLALFILDFYPLDRRREGFRRLLVEKIPFLLVSFGVGVMAVQGQRAASALAPLKDASLVHRLLLASRAPFFYLGKTLCPIQLCPVYFQEKISVGLAAFAAPLALIVITFIFLLVWRRKIKWPLVSWCLYLALLFPVSGVFRTGAVSVADRFSYLPALAGSFAVARFLSLPSGFARPIAKTAAVLVLAALAFLAIRQQGVWRTPRLLWESAARRSPGSALAFNNLGNALSGAGEDAAAREAYETALRLKADNPEAHTNLGNLLARAGDSEGAAVHYREALKATSRFSPEAYNNLGNVLARSGEIAEAVAQFEEALRLKPEYPEAHNNLANALALKGLLAAAAVHYREALRLKPDYPDAYLGLGGVLQETGKLDEAIECFRRCTLLAPGREEAHYYLGKALEALGRNEEAAVHLRRAAELCRGQREVNPPRKGSKGAKYFNRESRVCPPKRLSA